MSLRRFVAALAVLFLAGPALAGDRELVVGVEELEYYPLYAIRDGEYVGTAREILDAFARDRGYQLTYRPLPIKRLFSELMSGGVDLKFPDNPYWGAEYKQGRTVTYSKPVIAYVDGVLVRPSNHGKGADAVRTLGTVSGFTPYAWSERIRAGQVTVKENPRLELLLRQAVVGHVDGAYANVAVASHALANQLAMPGALMVDAALPHSRDHYMLSSAAKPEVVTQFNAWLSANGALVKLIKDRYGAERGVE